MSITTTTWPAEAHTIAKHNILKRYLDAWLPILSRAPNIPGHEVLFIDGFAGPGVYDGGTPGSPVIAAKAALDHSPFPRPVRMVFIEKEHDRYEELCRQIAPLKELAHRRGDVFLEDPILGSCEEKLDELLDGFEKRNKLFGPALAFLDQFGYSQVPMRLIQRILRYDRCEVFTYMSCFEMDRRLTDEGKAQCFQRAFNSDAWKKAIPLPTSRERQKKLLDLYTEELKTQGGAKYTWSFLMCNVNDTPLYWLIFCTKSLRGLEEMKKAMSKVDHSGEYRFSDATIDGQSNFFGSYSDDCLADDLAEQLRGRTLTATEVREYVLVKTRGWAFKSALGILENEDRVEITRPRECKQGFPKEHMGKIFVHFVERLF